MHSVRIEVVRDDLGNFRKEGFVINAYDRYVAIKMVNDKQCKIAWYIDNNKLSYMEPETVTDILEMIKRISVI